MPVITDFRIKDDFYLWEAYQGINGGYVITDFVIVDNYYLWLVILGFAPPTGTYTTTDNITASPVQTQAAATVMTTEYNRVDNAVANGDTVKFSPATVGKKQVMQNLTGFDITVYPAIGENFFGLAVNVPISVSDENELAYISYNAGELTTT